MSSLIVKVLQIEEILPFRDPPGTPEDKKTTSLVIIKLQGWYVVSSKSSNNFVGKKVVFIPPDSVLSEEFIIKAFEGSKISIPKNRRIKAVKIRGVISPGLALSLETCGLPENTPVNTDVAERLGITKYEAPEACTNNPGIVRLKHLDFSRYTDIENIKNFNHVFTDNEEVSVTLKLHGTSARYAKAKTSIRPFLPLSIYKTRGNNFKVRNLHKNIQTLKQHIKKFFGLLPEYEYVMGSRMTEIMEGDSTWFTENVYKTISDKCGIESKLKPGEALYGEIVGVQSTGRAIQKNFTYGLKNLAFFAYDVRIGDRWLDRDEFVTFCKERDILTVPELYRGPYSFQKIEELRNGNDHPLDKTVPCREGIVVRSVPEQTSPIVGRKILKAISDMYYTKDTTDLH